MRQQRLSCEKAQFFPEVRISCINKLVKCAIQLYINILSAKDRLFYRVTELSKDDP